MSKVANYGLIILTSRSPFIETIRSIPERDPITSPFTPEQSTQTLEES